MVGVLTAASGDRNRPGRVFEIDAVHQKMICYLTRK